MAKNPKKVSKTASVAATINSLNTTPPMPPNPEPWVIEPKEASPVPAKQDAAKTAAVLTDVQILLRNFMGRAVGLNANSLGLAYLIGTLVRYAYVPQDPDLQANLQSAIGATDMVRRVISTDPPLSWDDWFVDGVGHIVAFPGTKTTQQLLSYLPPIMIGANIGNPDVYSFNGLQQAAETVATAMKTTFASEVAQGGAQIILTGHSLGAVLAQASALKLNSDRPFPAPNYVPPTAWVYSYGMPAFWGSVDWDLYHNPALPEPATNLMPGYLHVRWYNPGDAICDLTSMIYRQQAKGAVGYSPGYPYPIPRHWSSTAAPVQFGNSAATVAANAIARGLTTASMVEVVAYLTKANQFAAVINENHAMSNYMGRFESILAYRRNWQPPGYLDLVAANRWMTDLKY